MDESKESGIKIGQIFLLSAAFSHDERVLALPATTPVGEHQVSLGVKFGLNEEETDGFVSLSVSSSDDNSGLYRFQIEMLAIFVVDPENKNLPLKEFMENNAPTVLFPFVREALANLTLRGRFGPVWLNPTNLKVVIAKAKAMTPNKETPAE